MSNARVHARNLLANWTAHGANMVVLFFLSPFVVHTLGKTEYGIWSLLTVLTGYMGIFDLGVRASTGRYVILYLGRQDHERVDETLRTSLGVFTIAGLLIFAAGIAIGLGFPVFFPSSPQEYHAMVAILLPVLAVNVWLSVVGAVFGSVLVAHDRFDLARTVDLTVLAVRTGGTILALRTGYGLMGLTAVTVGCSLLALAVNYAMARRIYPRMRVWPPALVRPRLREMFGYGIAAFISNIATRVVGQTSLVVVGALISVSAVTVFSVGAMLAYYLWTFLGQIGHTFFPPVQRAAAVGDYKSVRWYYLRQVRLGFVFGVPAYIGFIVFGHPFITLWMGGASFDESSVNQAALVLAVLSLSKLVALPSIGGQYLLASTGHIGYSAGVQVLEAVINVALSVFLVLVAHWGLAGVAVAALVARLLTSAVLIPWRANRAVKTRATRFLGVLGLGLVAGGVFAGWCLLMRSVIPGGSWALFGLQVALSLVGYVPIALGLLVPRDDRKRILRAIGVVSGSAG